MNQLPRSSSYPFGCVPHPKNFHTPGISVFTQELYVEFHAKGIFDIGLEI